jgi:hypothetical protein
MKKEQRRYPRIQVNLPVEIVTATGDALSATATNISLSGLELTCDRWTAHCITPKGHRTTPDQNIQAHLRLGLPSTSSSPVIVDVQSKVIVCRRFAADEYRIGVQYSRFEGDGFTNLKSYIQDRMRTV